MTAWLITNKYFINKSFDNLKKLLIKSANRHDVELTIYNNLEIINILSKNNYVRPNFVLFWDKDVKLANYIELQGIKVFNSSNSIRLCDDKSLTYLSLLNCNIKQPKTLFSPLLYYHNAAEDNDYLKFILEKFEFPFVFKECFGSFGQQVYLINNIEELQQKIVSVDVWPYIIQEFIKSSYGKDLRLYVVGGEVKASMKRENTKGDFRANIEIGSHGSKYYANDKQIEMALKVSKKLGLDFGGIDLLFGENDEPIFCEANSNAYFNELNKVADVNIEDYIFDHILMSI